MFVMPPAITKYHTLVHQWQTKLLIDHRWSFVVVKVSKPQRLGWVVNSAVRYQSMLIRCYLRWRVSCRPTYSKLGDHCRHYPFVMMSACIRYCVRRLHQHVAEQASGRGGRANIHLLLPPVRQCADVAVALITWTAQK